MEINDILSKLGLDLSNPEVRKGAIEAIDAILTSRTPVTAGDLGGGGGGEQDVELDPDLLQPSVKQAPSDVDDSDIEIEDEEKILDQIKHNDSEDPIENTNSDGDNSESDDESDDNNQSSDDTSSTDDSDKDAKQPDKDKASDSKPKDSEDENDELKNSTEDEEATSTAKASDDEDEADEDDDTEDFDNDDENDESDDTTDEAGSDQENFEDDEDGDFEEVDTGDIKSDDDDEDADKEFDDFEDEDEDENEDEEDEESENDFEDFDFDEDDLIDDELKNSTEDEEIKTKHDARKIKRERTLAAAKAALTTAQTNKVAPALIRELEKAIEALEALTEAVTKSLKDISDEEFNLLVNRVFDAIDACGGGGLTFTSEEEREAQVKEIKDDLSKAETQNELSAEDVAKIRAETQAVKAREKEAAKYSPRGRDTFKGFQEFLSSLYRAIALQVSAEETRDDSWSAISRRNSGAGVLRQGQKVNELPNKKIPIIDFYFDQSTSWNANDIKVGMKAVSQLADMEEKGQIKLNIFYFADEVSETPIRGGTSGWNEIVKNVVATQATNVVVMTDSDMQNWWVGPKPLSYTVPGYVWYLWKDGENAPRLPRDLKGRGGVQQFSFNINDI